MWLPSEMNIYDWRRRHYVTRRAYRGRCNNTYLPRTNASDKTCLLLRDRTGVVRVRVRIAPARDAC